MIEFLSQSTFFGAGLTIAAYALALMLRRRFKLAIFNPILIATLTVIAVLLLTGVPYETYAEGASVISYLLTPATVCLALPLYEKLQLLRKHWKAALIGIICGVLTNAVFLLALCLLFRLPQGDFATLLPKSITTAIGIGLAEEMGGISSLTVASIMLTGIFGSTCAELVFRFFRIHEPIAKGVAMGTATHAIGTARAMEIGPVEGAMSSVALVVCGLMTVVIAPLFINLI